MNVDYINPFIEASKSVLKRGANLDITMGKIFMQTSPYDSDSVVIVVGVTGKIRGQIIFTMTKEVGLFIVSSMMGGAPVTGFDEISRSAISELANMIAGNTAMILYNKGMEIAITPPSLLMGDSMQISADKMTTFCIPLNIDEDKVFRIDVSVEEEATAGV